MTMVLKEQAGMAKVVDELPDQSVDLWVLFRMQVVDVPSEAHDAVVLEGQAGGQGSHW